MSVAVLVVAALVLLWAAWRWGAASCGEGFAPCARRHFWGAGDRENYAGRENYDQRRRRLYAP